MSIRVDALRLSKIYATTISGKNDRSEWMKYCPNNSEQLFVTPIIQKRFRYVRQEYGEGFLIDS